jgi:hypothetical protein
VPPDRLSKGNRINAGVLVELRLDPLEEPPRLGGLDEPAIDHGPDVLQILLEAARNLGQGLGVEVVVEEIQAPHSIDETATITPTRELGDEIRRRGQLDVQPQGLLDARNGPVHEHPDARRVYCFTHQ